MKFQYFLVALFLSTSVATGNVGTFDLNNYRLPTWAFPAEYYLNIDLRWPENDTFRAYTWININVTEPNHYEVVLNVDPLYIDLNTSTIKVDTAEFICSDLDFSNETEIMVLSCMYDRYSNNTQYTQFEMYYTGKFSEYNSGLYKHSYEINGTTQTVIFTQFEEISFRKVFPSFDEPGYKAPISLSIDHYENLTVASNMPSQDDSNGLRESYIETVFNTTPPMSTYLLALVAGDSSVWSNTLIDYGHTKIFHQQIHKDYISVASDNALNLIDLMGEWTGIEYKDLGNPTMTLAALPGMAGAMENWGLITFGEGIIVDEGNRTTSKSIKNTITIMAHELSHQWFGDYVTLNWWSETWLNEGFASYFEWYLSDMLSTEENDYEFDKLFITAELQWALKADGPDAPPLSNNDSNVNTPLEISNCFGTISYAKGGSVLRMLRYALGEDVFQTGVREYLKAKALGNAKASDLLEHLQAALPDTTDIDLPTYMDSWIYQPDYPVVRTSIGEATSDFYLVSLDIYKYSPTLNETKDQNMSIWWVPISYITSDNPDPNNATYYWINPGRTFGFYVPTDESSWGIVNAGATGLYRVDYDPQTLERIINALNNNYSAIATENRAQLLDDVFNIAKFYTVKSEGYSDRPYQNAFKLAEYLKYETEYIPWYTYLQEVQYLLDEIQDDLTEEKLKEDVLALIEPQLLIPDSTNNISAYALNEMFKRNLLLDWASRLGQADAVAYVKSEYPKFLKDPESIDSNYRDIIICNGIRASDDPTKDYSTLMNLYSKSILPQERDDIAIGAACAPRSDLLKGYLASTLTAVPLVDKQYWANIFKTMSSKSSEGLDAALYFIVNHIDEISQKWRKVMTIETLLSTVSSKIVKQEQIKMLQSLLTKNSLSPSVTKAIKSAIDKAYVNIEWIDKMGTEITSILVYNGDDVPTTTTTEEIPTSTTTEEIPTTTDSKGVMTISNIIVILSFALLSKQIL